MISSQIQPKTRGVDESRLTPMQRVFCREYVKDFNGARAAKEAGSKQPANYATRQLKNPLVAVYLGKSLQERLWRIDLDADRVLREILCLALFDPASMYDDDGCLLPIDQMPESARRAISSFEMEVKEYTDEETGEVTSRTTVAKVRMHPKLDALRDLAKHLGVTGFNDKVQLEHTTSLGTIIGEAVQRMSQADDGVVDDSVIEGSVSEE